MGRREWGVRRGEKKVGEGWRRARLHDHATLSKREGDCLPVVGFLLFHSSNNHHHRTEAPWGWPSRGGAVLYQLSPSWEKIPPVEDPGLRDPLGEPGWLSW